MSSLPISTATAAQGPATPQPRCRLHRHRCGGAEANRIVQKLWSYCTVLRDDGLSYGDYLEQLSVLLFLKLAHEQT